MKTTCLKTVVCLLITVFYSSSLFAICPGKVDGTVIDAETRQAVPFAGVELLKSGDSTLMQAVITNENGTFMIEQVPCGKYLLRISCMAYQKTILPEFAISDRDTFIHAGTILLIASTETLGEVKVSVPRLSGIIKNNKTIYTVSNASAEIAQSGLELLRQLPDVTVNYFSDEVKLAGNSNILFQVNGRKVDNNYLMQLNPGLVDKIEVINSPGANYDGAVDAVINIILKREFRFGVGGQFRITPPVAKDVFSKNKANIDIYLKNKRFYLAGKYNLSDYYTENINNRTIFSPGKSLSQKTYGREKGQSLGINSGLDWFIDERNTLSVYGSLEPGIPNTSELKTNNTYSGEETGYNTGFTSKSNTKSFYDYSVYFRHEFSKKMHFLSFEHYLSNRTGEGTGFYQEQEDVNIPLYMNIQNQFYEDKNVYTYMKTDYCYPLSSKILFSSGYTWYFLKKKYSYSDLITQYNDITDFKEIRHAVYFSLSSDFGKFSIQPGIRYEYSDIEITHRYDTTSYYNHFLPSLNISYKADAKNTFRFNYRKSLGRPGINQLSPVNYKDDSYNESKGNPKLKPSTRNRFEIEHRVQLGQSTYFNYKPYIHFIKDGISQVNILVSDSVLLKQYSNVSTEKEFGITFSGSVIIKKIWTISPSFTCYRRALEAMPEYGIQEDLKNNSWRLNISSNLILPKEWIFFIEFNYDAPVITYQSKKHAYYDFAFGLNKVFNKKLAVSAVTINPWSNRYVYEKVTYTTESMVQNTENAIKYDYIFLLRLTYKFKSGKMGKKNNRDIESEAEQLPAKGILN